MTDNPQCLLGDYLSEFIDLCRNIKTTDQLLGKYLDDAQTGFNITLLPRYNYFTLCNIFVLFLEIDVTSALDRLADPSYNLPALGSVVSKTTTVVTRATARLQIKPEEAPIPPALLDEILVVRFYKKSDTYITILESGQ